MPHGVRRPAPSRRGGGATRGQILPVVALSFVILVGIVGLAVDAGHDYLVRRDEQNAVDSAGMAAGQQLGASTPTGPPNTGATLLQVANSVLGDNGFATVFSSTCDTHTTNSFTTSWFDSKSGYAGVAADCSKTTGFSTEATINVPPCGIAAGGSVPFPYSSAQCTGVDSAQPSSPHCQKFPYNCVQIVLRQQVTNYITGIFGASVSMTTVQAVAFAQPPGVSAGTPGPSALSIFQPATGCTGQCLDRTKVPSRSMLSCSSSNGNNCPALWVKSGTDPEFNGINGTLTSAGTDQPVIQSNGDVVLEDRTVICDPFAAVGKKVTCTSSSAQGAMAIAVAEPDSNNRNPLMYCSGVSGGAATPTAPACTTAGPGGDALGALVGNETTYSATSYTATVSQQSLNCGGLILNGDTVANSFVGTHDPLCVPPAGEEYTVIPGKYQYIVVNHGAYTFESGVFEVTALAPVNNNTTGAANGIDHGRETSADFDLCTGGAANSCGGQGLGACTSNGGNSSQCLTAGVWIGHGLLGATSNGSNGVSGTCSGPATQNGGGDATSVQGVGVTFLLDSTSGGFVSTHEVNAIGLTSPGVGASKDISSGAPILIDLENNGFVHVDAVKQDTNQLTGIIYQKPSATGGGMEINAAMSDKVPAVNGQAVVYSFTTFGGTGTAIDFQNGYGTSSAPTITTSGKNEAQIVGKTSLTAWVDPSTGSQGVDPANNRSLVAFTLQYTDEWQLDGYDSYIQVGSNSAVFFSQGMWYAKNPRLQPPEPNDPGGASPGAYASDVNPQFPWYPTAPGTYNGTSGSYSVALDPSTNRYDDYKIQQSYQGGGTAWFETSGDWIWGHSLDLFGTTAFPWSSYKGQGYAATVTYIFDKPVGNTVSITMGLFDGDRCGDYAVYTGTFNTPGGSVSGGGFVTSSTVGLEQ